MIRVLVIGGWSEKRFYARLFAKGFDGTSLKLTSDVSKADVIVAHSAACYNLPDAPKARLFLLVAPPYWPGKSILNRTLQAVVANVPGQIQRWGLAFFIKIRLLNLAGVLATPIQNFRDIFVIRRNFLADLPKAKIIVVRNRLDPFCSPSLSSYAKKFKNVSYVEMAGYHGELWYDPRAYVDLIIKEYN